MGEPPAVLKPEKIHILKDEPSKITIEDAGVDNAEILCPDFLQVLHGYVNDHLFGTILQAFIESWLGSIKKN